MQPKKNSGRTLFALGFGYLVDQGENQTIGVLSAIIQSVWGVTYAQIGLMETLRNITQTVSAPFWGYMADRYNRKNVLIFGTGIWGIWTILVGLVPNFSSMLVIRAISGLGLGCLMPATFSLLGDHYAQNQRGRALGVIGLVGALGNIVGVIALGFVATPELWRWGFIGLGLASVLTGVIIFLLVEELPRGSAEPELAGLINEESQRKYKINVRDMLSTLRIPTIWAAILQGITGSMPWVILTVFFINWMVTELGYANTITFSHDRGSAPIVFALIVVGVAAGNLVGGYIGDYAEQISWKYGRTVIGQFSVLIGVPLSYVMLRYGPQMTFSMMVILAGTTAMLISWAGRGSKEPMMQAIVPPEIRSSAYSVVSLIEGGFSSFAGIIFGFLTTRLPLTEAMLWMVPFPWIICGLFFSIFYFTYPRDAEKMRARLLAQREELLRSQKMVP